MEDVILLFPGYSESMKMGYKFQRKMLFVPLKMLKCISIVVSRIFSLQSRSSTCKKKKSYIITSWFKYYENLKTVKKTSYAPSCWNDQFHFKCCLEKLHFLEFHLSERTKAIPVWYIWLAVNMHLCRHGRHHTIMPSNVNYRANIWALKEENCSHVLVTTACGSLREEIQPGDLIMIDQFIDRWVQSGFNYVLSLGGEKKVWAGLSCIKICWC